MFVPLVLLLLFAALSKRSNLSDPGGNGTNSSGQLLQTAANAKPGAVRPVSTSATEEEARQRAAVNAAVAKALREEQARQSAAAEKNKPPAVSRKKSVALALANFLNATQRFGSKADRVSEVSAAQTVLGVTADGIVGPATREACLALGVTLPLRPTVTPAAVHVQPGDGPNINPSHDADGQTPPPGAATTATFTDTTSSAPAEVARTPEEAAKALRAFLLATKRFGSKADRPEQVKAAQRDLGVTDDGIVGPSTRAAARKYKVTLPARAAT